MGPVHRLHDRRLPGSGATERSSGGSRSQGSITKTGNSHARRLLVEAAWHHRKTYRSPGLTMRARWAAAPPPAAVRGREGNYRLHSRWESYADRRKKPVVAGVAVARELAGWCRSFAHHARLTAGTQDRRAAVTVVAARGVTREKTMSSNGFVVATLDLSTSGTLQPNSPSCGNQPAHVSLPARRPRHAHDRDHRPAPHMQKR